MLVSSTCIIKNIGANFTILFFRFLGYSNSLVIPTSTLAVDSTKVSTICLPIVPFNTFPGLQRLELILMLNQLYKNKLSNLQA